ncbi:RICIN domain-containing protein [Zooshikella marina]|uniref:RICIN domain-containing protein n=1 Tax=Zooshikella ganghwensis TaxID=202772 RepID=UPI001BAEC263|nr:RICIN domain-containing protein [Zooshikella ganghwensis]MBU2708140.1 RICIN domain-containing protein [Zooshikella ganghwensis]
MNRLHQHAFLGVMFMAPSVVLGSTNFIGLYKIINKHSGKALEVTALSEADGANIQQWQFVKGANQYWRIKQVGNDQYILINQLSKKVLDVTSAKKNDGNNIQQWSDNGTGAQRFLLTELKDGSYKITSKLTGKVLDVQDWATNDGGNISQWSWHGGDNQRWDIIPQHALTEPMKGTYKIVSKISNKVIDVAERSKRGAANVQQWQYGSSDNQHWQLLYQGSGYYKIKAQHSGLMLDVANAGTNNGVNIQQWHENGNDAQLFSLIKHSSSQYFLVRNKLSGKVLDVTDWATYDGANIQQWQTSAQDNQLWKFELVSNDDKPTPPDQCKKLVWHDEFNYQGKPDPSKWGYDTGGSGWGNNELQHYTDRLENARVNGSRLIIEAKKENFHGNKYTSARLVTRGKGDWTYGRIEVKAKLPAGRGTWPAIWMLPTDWKHGGWPNSGEIDIMEYVGYEPNVVHGAIHTELRNHMRGNNFMVHAKHDQVEEAEQVYAIEWNKNKIDFFINNHKYGTYQNNGKGVGYWPFNERFHLILNIAFGGNWGGAKGIDDSIFNRPVTMEVDYVRVYQLKGNCQ